MNDMVEAVFKNAKGEILETKMFDSDNDAAKYGHEHYPDSELWLDGKHIPAVDSADGLVEYLEQHPDLLDLF